MSEDRKERHEKNVDLSAVTLGACPLPVLSLLGYRAGLVIWEQEGWRGSELLLNAVKLSPKYVVLSDLIV